MREAVSNVVKVKIHHNIATSSATTDRQLSSVKIRLLEKYRDGSTQLNQEAWKNLKKAEIIERLR